MLELLSSWTIPFALFSKIHARRASRFASVMAVPAEWQGKTMDRKEILALYEGQVNVKVSVFYR